MMIFLPGSNLKNTTPEQMCRSDELKDVEACRMTKSRLAYGWQYKNLNPKFQTVIAKHSSPIHTARFQDKKAWQDINH